MEYTGVFGKLANEIRAIQATQLAFVRALGYASPADVPRSMRAEVQAAWAVSHGHHIANFFGV